MTRDRTGQQDPAALLGVIRARRVDVPLDGAWRAVEADVAQDGPTAREVGRRRSAPGAPSLRWGLAAVAAVAAAVAVLVPTWRPAPAFAGWTAEPERAAADALTAECGAALSAAHAPKGLRARVTERRGSSSLALADAPGAAALCLSVAGEAHAWWDPVDGAADADVLRVSRLSVTGQTVGVVLGRAPEGSSVRVTADGGPAMTATAAGGYFVAWWPAEEVDGVTAEITAADGERTSVTRPADR